MEELKQRRLRLDLSQSKLADFLEVDLATFQHIEQGTRAIPRTKIHKFNMFKRIEDVEILIAIYNNETVTKTYRQISENEGVN